MAQPVTLNFRDRRRPKIMLELVEGDFPIDPNIDVEDMGEALVAEQAVHELIDRVLTGIAEEEDLDKVKDEVRAKAQSVKAFIEYLVRKETPGAPSLSLKADEVLEIGRAISGNQSITQEVIEAITALAGDAALKEGAGATSGEEEASPEGKDAPLASKKRSRKRSSRSAGSTSGRPSTGASSPGASSAPTSKTRARG